MGYIKNICITAAVVGSAFAGYFLYKRLVQDTMENDNADIEVWITLNDMQVQNKIWESL